MAVLHLFALAGIGHNDTNHGNEDYTSVIG